MLISGNSSAKMFAMSLLDWFESYIPILPIAQFTRFHYQVAHRAAIAKKSARRAWIRMIEICFPHLERNFDIQFSIVADIEARRHCITCLRSCSSGPCMTGFKLNKLLACLIAKACGLRLAERESAMRFWESKIRTGAEKPPEGREWFVRSINLSPFSIQQWGEFRGVKSIE